MSFSNTAWSSVISRDVFNKLAEHALRVPYARPKLVHSMRSISQVSHPLLGSTSRKSSDNMMRRIRLRSVGLDLYRTHLGYHVSLSSLLEPCPWYQSLERTEVHNYVGLEDADNVIETVHSTVWISYRHQVKHRTQRNGRPSGEDRHHQAYNNHSFSSQAVRTT